MSLFEEKKGFRLGKTPASLKARRGSSGLETVHAPGGTLPGKLVY
jgi:hypothetical protein